MYHPSSLVIPKSSVIGEASLAAELPVTEKTNKIINNCLLVSIFQRLFSFFNFSSLKDFVCISLENTQNNYTINNLPHIHN